MDARRPSSDEIELFKHARDLLASRHDPVIHQVAAAARTADGRIYQGLHIGSRRINVCAESSAIANARMEGDEDIVAMVAVCKNDAGDIVVTNPCGVCRELMGTYLPDSTVLVDVHGEVRAVPAASLLPLPWMFPHENDWSVEDPTASSDKAAPHKEK